MIIWFATQCIVYLSCGLLFLYVVNCLTEDTFYSAHFSFLGIGWYLKVQVGYSDMCSITFDHQTIKVLSQKLKMK